MSNEELQQLQPHDLTKEHYPLDIKLCSEELPTDFREYVLVYVHFLIMQVLHILYLLPIIVLHLMFGNY